jgi:riboflavin kinase/FMN adenylyltransferase
MASPADIRVVHSLEEAAGSFGPSGLTIGNFDGVHLGHQALCRRLVERCRALAVRPSVLTFDPHPARVLAPDRAPRLLCTLDQRLRRMAEAGIEQALVLPFTSEFSQWSPEDFVARVIAGAAAARVVVVGSNFRFGRRHAGDVDLLRELGLRFGFETEIVEGVFCRGRLVSSTEVRRLLDSGDVRMAGRLLGRCYGLEGNVVSGAGIGAKQAVPTLNLATDAEVLPARGVYITRTTDLEDGRRWRSVTNVGYRPTFGGESLTVETFLLDGLDGFGPAKIRVEFLYRLREERKFPDAPALRMQIMRDVGRAQRFFARIGLANLRVI